MPSLKQAMISPDMDKLERLSEASAVSVTPMQPSPQPQFNPFLRCPMPIATTPDAQRQYYRDGVPQTRIIVPAAISRTTTIG